MREAARGQTETVRSLVSRRQESPKHLRFTLCIAAAYGHTKIVEILLTGGVPIDSECRAPFQSMGIDAGKLALNSSPLTNAARGGHAETTKVLLKWGANINATNSSGWTALMWAARKGHAGIVRLLLENGAELHSTSRKGLTALGLARIAGHMDIAGMLDRKLGKNNAGTEPLLRSLPAENATMAPTPDSGGISKAELQKMMAEVLRRGPAAEEKVPLEYLSDIDTPAYRLTQRPDDFAIVVGIEKYSDLPDAQFAERDAESVKSHLIALGYPSRNVIHLSGSKAVRSGIEKFLEDWLPRNVKGRSRVFFYFSGHGAPDPKTGRAYLVPWDGDANFLERTGYPLTRLYEKLNALKASEVFVTLDACFSGAGGRSVLARGARPLVTNVDASAVPQAKLLVFAAAAGNEITSTLQDQGHGIFTYFFLKGLSGGAKNPSGVITANGLYDYLKPQVQDAARRQNREQTPVLQGERLKEIVRFE